MQTEGVVINRLRSGRTQLTHGYLMETIAPQVFPICQFCSNLILTVKHLVLTYPVLHVEKQGMNIFPEKKVMCHWQRY